MSRARLLVAAALVVAAGAVQGVAAPAPAGAAPAPLVTEDGIGIRVDEAALTGPVLDAVEAEVEQEVEDVLLDAAAANTGVVGHAGAALDPALAVDLTLDAVTAGTTGFPAGGFTLTADVTALAFAYDVPAHSCTVGLDGGSATATARSRVDTSLLPLPPFGPLAAVASWPATPVLTVTNLPCLAAIDVVALGAWWTHLVDRNDPTSAAAQVDAALGAHLDALLAGAWGDHVDPVIQSASGFGLTAGVVTTDTHGLVVTLDVDASAGVTVPGLPGGPHDVSGATDSGASSNVLVTLADRTSPAGIRHVIVSYHPNVVNQHLVALTAAVGPDLGVAAVPAAIEAVLLQPADQAAYADGGWAVRLRVTAPPEASPAGSPGEVDVALPQVRLIFTNTSYGFGVLPVATFTGSLGDVPLVHGPDAGATAWVPGLDPAAPTGALTRTQANPQAALVAPPATGALLPSAALALDAFATSGWIPFARSSPTVTAAGFAVDPCAGCGGSAGDQHATRTFLVS